MDDVDYLNASRAQEAATQILLQIATKIGVHSNDPSIYTGYSDEHLLRDMISTIHSMMECSEWCSAIASILYARFVTRIPSSLIKNKMQFRAWFVIIMIVANKQQDDEAHTIFTAPAILRRHRLSVVKEGMPPISHHYRRDVDIDYCEVMQAYFLRAVDWRLHVTPELLKLCTDTPEFTLTHAFVDHVVV